MSTAEKGLDRAIASLTRIVLGRESLEESLQRIAELARAHLVGADSVSLTVVRDDGTPRTVACTDGMALAVDEVQYRSRRGPCLEASQRSEPVRVDSILDAGQWPEFASAALEQGVRASLSLPMVVDDEGIGAINAYSRMESPWTPASEETGTRLAQQAAIAVANMVVYSEATEAARHLEQALRNRDVIGQAKGILMERHKITADEAFERLREISQRQNVKLREVAETLAATGALPEPAPSR